MTSITTLATAQTGNHGRFYDQILGLIDHGMVEVGVLSLTGKLYGVREFSPDFDEARRVLRGHPLDRRLSQDPYCRRCRDKPRGYAGDAALIDMIYNRSSGEALSDHQQHMFQTIINFPINDAVRKRRDYATVRLRQALTANKSILCLAAGHFREALPLLGMDFSNVTVVDQDPLSLDEVRAAMADAPTLVEANVLHFLRSAAQQGRQWDFIYTLGLTDYFDDKAMRLFHTLLARCLCADGSAMLANFIPGQIAIGWMEAVMDWHLIYRDEAALAGFARAAGLRPCTWQDDYAAIAYCEMFADGAAMGSDTIF
ncbi:MAG: hypothetical protein ABL909_08435 [Sphingopyxis sp.]